MDNEKKILVAYFSASGITERTAKTLSEAADADLFEIKPEVLYTSADLNWNNPSSRSTVEMKDASSRPGISDKVTDMDKYDVVFVGFPIWWYIAPTIINTFLESYDFSGKTVIPFATSGGSGMGKTEEKLHSSCSDATKWKHGKILSSRLSGKEAQAWIDSLNLN